MAIEALSDLPFSHFYPFFNIHGSHRDRKAKQERALAQAALEHERLRNRLEPDKHSVRDIVSASREGSKPSLA